MTDDDKISLTFRCVHLQRDFSTGSELTRKSCHRLSSPLCVYNKWHVHWSPAGLPVTLAKLGLRYGAETAIAFRRVHASALRSLRFRKLKLQRVTSDVTGMSRCTQCQHSSLMCVPPGLLRTGAVVMQLLSLEP